MYLSVQVISHRQLKRRKSSAKYTNYCSCDTVLKKIQAWTRFESMTAILTGAAL